MTDHGSDDRGFKGFLKRNAIDVRPLQVTAFRNLWLGEVITNIGAQITAPVLLIQITVLTDSALAAGLLGAVLVVPLMLGTLWGGPLIDRFDRRKLLLITECLIAATSLGLLVVSLMPEPPLWSLYFFGGVASFIWGIDLPTRTAMVPNLVPRELLQAAITLNYTMWSVSQIIGMGLAGLAFAIGGAPLAYSLDLVTFGFALVLIWRIPPQPPIRSSDHDPDADDPVTWEAIKEGFRYLKGRKVLQSTFTIDLIAMVFGLPDALFPILAITFFGLPPEAAAWMYFALAVGALVATLTNGWVYRVRHQGRAVVWAVITWGAAIAAFGLSTSNFLLALVFLAIAGGADTISAVFRGTILQSTVPDDLRGRISSFHFLVVAGGPQLGKVEAGIVATIWNPIVAVVSGGLLCIGGAIANAWLVPEFWNYHAGEDTKPASSEAAG